MINKILLITLLTLPLTNCAAYGKLLGNMGTKIAAGYMPKDNLNGQQTISRCDKITFDLYNKGYNPKMVSSVLRAKKC